MYSLFCAVTAHLLHGCAGYGWLALTCAELENTVCAGGRPSASHWTAF